MKVELKIDKDILESKITIEANSETEEIKALYNKLLNDYKKLTCYSEDEKHFIEYSKIESVYSLDGKVYLRDTEGHEYQLRNRIYELQDILPNNSFLRISNSEIVNFDNVEKINLKLSGTVLLIFKSGRNAFSSRRYIKKIKEFLK